MPEPRRYLAVIQDPRGYPAAGEPLEKTPPDGPEQPMIVTVVKADEYEAEVGRLRAGISWVRGMCTDGESLVAIDAKLGEILNGVEQGGAVT